MVKTQLPEGAKVATQFMPDTVSGYNTDLQPCAYDPEKAKALLKEAGAEGMTLQFAFPTEVTRPYMPDPQKIHAAFTKDLEAVGIKVDTVSKPWNGGYLDDTNGNKYDAWLLGWTGDYNAADNFIGTFFANIDQNDFNTKAYPWGKTLSEDLKKADAIVDVAEREAAYKKINQQIAEEYLPGIPISHSPPALVVSGNVEGLVPSPLTAETFDTVTVNEVTVGAAAPDRTQHSSRWPPRTVRVRGGHRRSPAKRKGPAVARFIIRRLLQMIGVVFALSLLLFFWLRALPGRRRLRAPRRARHPGHPGGPDRGLRPRPAGLRAVPEVPAAGGEGRVRRLHRGAARAGRVPHLPHPAARHDRAEHLRDGHRHRVRDPARLPGREAARARRSTTARSCCR